MSEAENEYMIDMKSLEKVSGGAALKTYYYKCVTPGCRQYNHSVKVMLPRTDVKVKCKACNNEMVLQP